MGLLASRLERITQKHVGLQILPRHYPFVADALLGASKDVLGEAATPEICAAWVEAYWFLANLLIARETDLYRQTAAAPGGWNAWRDFAVESTKQESEITCSLVLAPLDGKPVLRHRSGQYLKFNVDVPGATQIKHNYSISSGPDDRAYRITVKREAGPGLPPGLASNGVHDQADVGTVLEVAPPSGEFFLDEDSPGSIVLLGGGGGLTPMVSMLDAIVRSGSGRPTWYVHGAQNGRVHAMREHVRPLAAGAQGVVSDVLQQA